MNGLTVAGLKTYTIHAFQNEESWGNLRPDPLLDIYPSNMLQQNCKFFSRTANFSAELGMFQQKMFQQKICQQNSECFSRKCFSRITGRRFLLKHLNVSEECPPANINGFIVTHVLPSVTGMADADILFI